MKQELLSITQSAKLVIEKGADESSATAESNTSESCPEAEATAAPDQQPCSVASPPPPCERVKIVLSIQGKDGAKQFRVFAVCIESSHNCSSQHITCLMNFAFIYL